MIFPRADDGTLESAPIRRENARFAVRSSRNRMKRMPLMRGRNYSLSDLDETIGWNPKHFSTDTSIAHNMDLVRARARQLAGDNPYAKSFLRSVIVNVAGPCGAKFQSRVRFNGGKKKGSFNRLFNKELERLYKSAGKPKNKPTRDGKKSMRRAQQLWIQSLWIDGEVIVMFHPGSSKNSSRFQVEFIDPSRLDWTLNQRLTNGGWIKMGVEFDADGEPVAYHILEDDPHDTLIGGVSRHRHQRVEAKYIRHTFIEEAPNQTRGVTQLASAGLRAHLIEQFEKANVIGGIVAARKVGFYKVNQEKAEEYGVLGNEIEETGEECEDVNDDAALVQEVEAGMMEQLPSYIDDVISLDHGYPPANFEEFEKRMIRGMAAGFGGQYHQIANDLEGVNYTSSRTGELSQREQWRNLQELMIEEFLEFHFEGWAEMLLLRSDVQIDSAVLQRLLSMELYEFVPRGWAWVDPLKEITAHEKAIALGITTRSIITAETSARDFEDVIEELADEEEMMRDRGIDPRPEKNPEDQPPKENNDE